jgi:GH43 family beta-xylosidase
MLFVMLVLLAAGAVYPQADEEQVGTIRNPLNPYGGADPWLTYYEGNYYLATTTWRSEWLMRSSPTLAGLKTAEPVQIYFETEPSRCCNFWAPEFHLLEGPNGLRWYFYYTAGTSGTYDNQRTHVLESEGTDPMGPYTYKGRVFDRQNDVWMIDGSVMQLDGSLYFLFSAFEGGLQSMFIAPMSDPWTISGERVLISQPDYRWEQSGGFVNEGPVALQHEDDTFIIYSASACWGPDYKLGMLTYTGGDPLDPDSWVKHPEPVFERSDENGVFAPGHNGFFRSPDGTEDWIVYHANDSISGGCDGRRTTRVQPITWNEDGTPNFGVPVSTDEAIASPSGDTGVDPMPEFPAPELTRFQSLGLDGAYLRHANFQLRLDFTVNPLADSQFMVVPGLADPEAISIESSNFPGFFVRHQNNVILLTADDGSDTFEEDATWWIRPGLADESWISFEAYSRSGSYIGRMFGVLALIEPNDSTAERALADATFLEER